MAGGRTQPLDRGNEKEANNRASWNEMQRDFLVELLVEFDRSGARQQNGWGSVAWNEMTRRFNAKFPNTNFSQKQIKEQEHTLNKQYKTIQRLRDQSGFGWSDTTNMVTTSDEVWAPLLNDKEIKRWYNKSFPYYDDLHRLYCGSIATGKRRKGSNNFQNWENIEVGLESPSPTISAPGSQPLFEDDDDFLNIQTEDPPICTQQPPPIQPPVSTPGPIPRNPREGKKRKNYV